MNAKNGEEEPFFYLSYNKEQSDVVIDGLCYNQPFGITVESWNEIEKYIEKMGWSKFQYKIEMDNKNFRFILKER